jgi:hypothetical protein
LLDVVDVPDPDEDVEAATEADPEFDVLPEVDVDPPPSDEDAAAGFSEPPLDSAAFAAGFELPLAA